MASARKVHELGFVMNTESRHSSENRHQDSSPAQEAQRTGAFGWGERDGLVPPWSVPPGLIVPSPRAPQPDAPAGGENPVQEARDANPVSNQDPTHGAPVGKRPLDEAPAAEDDAWPGIAAPAGWFLRVKEVPPPISASPPSSVPSPHREPDGSWSSPLPSATPGPARVLGPTEALGGHPGGPGFQPGRTGGPARRPTAGLSPWQISQQLWSEAGIQWDQRPAARTRPPHPAMPAQFPPVEPTATPPPPKHVPGGHVTSGSLPPDHANSARTGPMPLPLGAPVFPTPVADQDDGADHDAWTGPGHPPPPGLLDRPGR